LKFIIPDQPISKERHRCGCKGNHPFAYDPQINKDMKKIRASILSQWNEAFESPKHENYQEALYLAQARSFEVAFVFVFMPPRSFNQEQINRVLWGLDYHNSKPDFDNLEKMYSDCLTDIVWKDDSQVSISSSKKIYDLIPRTEITIMHKKEIKLHPKAEHILQIFGPQKLKDFLHDSGTISETFHSEEIEFMVDKSNESYRQHLMAAATSLLSDFADKYADDLMKVNKYKKAQPLTPKSYLSDVENGDLCI
jgi:Holliday junction resolvase RusA-like endonuclease